MEGKIVQAEGVFVYVIYTIQIMDIVDTSIVPRQDIMQSQ